VTMLCTTGRPSAAQPTTKVVSSRVGCCATSIPSTTTAAGWALAALTGRHVFASIPIAVRLTDARTGFPESLHRPPLPFPRLASRRSQQRRPRAPPSRRISPGWIFIVDAGNSRYVSSYEKPLLRMSATMVMIFA
jgi:hypothetical protein